MTSDTILPPSNKEGRARVDLRHVRVRISVTHTQVGLYHIRQLLLNVVNIVVISLKGLKVNGGLFIHGCKLITANTDDTCTICRDSFCIFKRRWCRLKAH
jgi:hypothetical protein